MLTDPREQLIAAAFKAARPLPRAGWDVRALAAVADIRPRRHPNLLTIIIVTALILLLAAGVFAAVRYFFIEGTLQFHDVSLDRSNMWQGHSPRTVSADMQWTTGVTDTPAGDISRVSDEMVFEKFGDGLASILKANLDGSEEVDLTAIAGLEGISCQPVWSPDASMIAFRHCDPVEDLMPCEAGFQLWVMNTDGTGAHRVTREGSLPTVDPSWWPDGSRLLAWMGDWHWEGEQVGAISTDIWGADIRVLPNVGKDAACSPDGSMIASVWHQEDEVDGEPGWRNQLLLTDPAGSHPRILVEQFLARGDLEAYYPTEAMLESRPCTDYWIYDVVYHAGPLRPVWSPDSDKVAFLAALPFEPGTPLPKDLIDVWMYDLTTDELIRITHDDVAQCCLIWK